MRIPVVKVARVAALAIHLNGAFPLVVVFCNAKVMVAVAVLSLTIQLGTKYILIQISMMIVVELVVWGRADTIVALAMLITNDFSMMFVMVKVRKITMAMVVAIKAIIVVGILTIINVTMVHIVQRRNSVVARISTGAGWSIGAKYEEEGDRKRVVQIK